MEDSGRGERKLLDEAELMSAAKYIGYYCADENIEFVRCKEQDKDPGACARPGAKVTACVFNVVNQLESKCGEEFKHFKECMYYNNIEFPRCRAAEQALERCWRAGSE